MTMMTSPHFANTLAVSPYPDGVTWYLDHGLKYIGSHGEVRVPKGFETDFASVPRVVTNIFPRWGKYGPASVVHDWLYWNQIVTKATADAVFLEAMAVCGVGLAARGTLYSAVRYFGGWAWADNARLAAAGYSRVRSAGALVPAWHR